MSKPKYSLIFPKANRAFSRVLVKNKILWMPLPRLFEGFPNIFQDVLPLFLYMFNSSILSDNFTSS